MQNTSWLKNLYLNGSSKEQQMCLSLRNMKPNFLSSLSQQFSLLKTNNSTATLYNWILSFCRRLPSLQFYLIFTTFSPATNKSILQKQRKKKYVCSLTQSLASPVQCPHFFCASTTFWFLSSSPVYSKASLEAIVRLKAEHERPHFVPTVPFTPSAAHFNLFLHSHYKKNNLRR